MNSIVSMSARRPEDDDDVDIDVEVASNDGRETLIAMRKTASEAPASDQHESQVKVEAMDVDTTEQTLAAEAVQGT